jgi:hypothetical protein
MLTDPSRKRKRNHRNKSGKTSRNKKREKIRVRLLLQKWKKVKCGFLINEFPLPLMLSEIFMVAEQKLMKINIHNLSAFVLVHKKIILSNRKHLSIISPPPLR